LGEPLKIKLKIKIKLKLKEGRTMRRTKEMFRRARELEQTDIEQGQGVMAVHGNKGEE